MLLSKISNLKYFVDFLKSYFLGFIRSFRLFNDHVIVKPKISFLVWVLGYTFWMAVFVPSEAYSLSLTGVKEGFEAGQSFHVHEYQSTEKFVDFIGCSGAFYPDIVSQIQDCAQKDVSKLRGGSIPFLQVDQAKRCFDSLPRKIAGYSSADNSTNKSTNNGGLNSSVHNDSTTPLTLLLAMVVFLVTFFSTLRLIEWLIWRFFPPYKT